MAKPGQVDAGSGTTPTITPRGNVAITDNADPMNVLLYDRVTGAEVCRAPVFAAGASASDNSLVAFNDALIVENNHGYTGPTATEQGATTTGGIARVDYDPAKGTCGVTWTSDEISPTVVPKVSLANGLLYVWTKPAGEKSDPWYLTAIDARSGATVFKQLAGTGLGFNNNYAPITLGPDGTAYTGVLGGLVAIRDATPPPGAVAPSSAAAGSCRRLPGPKLGLRGTRLRLVPSGLSDVTLTRQWRHGRTVRSRVLRTIRRLRAQRTISMRGMPAGTYVVGFRSGEELRRRVVGLHGGRLRRGAGRVESVRSCGRVSTPRARFDGRGLRVTVASSNPSARIAVRAHRAGHGKARRIKPDRVTGTNVVHAHLALPRGRWLVAAFVDGRNIGRLAVRRPR